jgi:hypothetical protein
MVWQSILDKEQINIKVDLEDREAIIEVNDGGISPTYVTVRIQDQEIDEWIAALQQIKELTK